MLDIQEAVVSVSTRRRVARALLVALLFFCFVGMQVASAAHEHSDARSHCCPICTASHSPSGPAVAAVEFGPPGAVNWPTLLDPDQHLDGTFSRVHSSRGPPTSFFSI